MPTTTVGALPGLVVIGAMKAGTSALHRYLDAHPDIAMSEPKELCFFYGTEPDPTVDDDGWSASGNWWRGVAWYRRHFPADGRLGGESSPGYTSPAHPGAAARLARTIPRARLVYLVRDPLERAVSQYRHHLRDGAETRDLATALLDPASQYLARSRYHDRLRPWLDHVPTAQLLVVTHEDLRDRRRATLRRVQAHVGVAPHWSPAFAKEWHVAQGSAPTVPPDVAAAVRERVADDVERLRPLVRTEGAATWL